MKTGLRSFLIAFVFTAMFGLGSSASADGTLKISEAEFLDKLKGGFVGEIVGVTFAAPYEFKYDGVMMPESALGKWNPAAVAGALFQDDIYVDLTFLEALEKYGLDITIAEAGEAFGASKYDLWHANLIARENLQKGVAPPLSGHPKYNIHADDIDFQIEADVLGLISPGMPAAAQKLAWRIGHVMNYGDGVYGGVFMTAMYAAAYFESDPVKVVRAGLAAIPAESNYAKTIADVVKAYEKNPSDWQAAWRLVEKNWGDRGHCSSRRSSNHVYPFGIGANINGAYVAMALLFGGGDAMLTAKIATLAGRDNDCNAASAMGVLGTMKGFKALPQELVSGVSTLNGRKFAYTKYGWQKAISVMAEKAYENIALNGGEKETEDGGTVLIIPSRAAVALPLEQWPYTMPAADVPLPEYEY